MNAGDLSPEDRAALVKAGVGFMGLLAQGPERWAKLPTHIKPELIGGYIEVMARDTSGRSSNACMIQNLHMVATTVVTILADEMAAWAVANGREDLLAPMTARVEDSIKAADDAGE
jgi:hypothetical protein